MSQTPSSNHKSSADFWRACRYLWPHRRIVIISIFCALAAGIFFTSGLSAMLPILRVLIYGERVQTWVDRQVAESRLGVALAENGHAVQIIKIKDAKLAADNHLQRNDELTISSAKPTDEDAGAVVGALADPNAQQATVIIRHEGEQLTQTLQLRPLPWYWHTVRQASSFLPRDKVLAIGAVFGVLAGLALLGNFVRFFQEYLSEKAAILATDDLRRHLYDHVLYIPLEFFGLRGTSDATSRLTQDANGLQEGFKQVLGNSIQQPINAVMAFGLAMLLSWKLTLFVVLFAPAIYVLIRKFGKKMRRASKKMLQSSSDMLGHLEGTLLGLRVVKASTAESYERRRYRAIMAHRVRQQLRMSKIDAMSGPIIESLTLLLVGGIVMYAAYLVLKARSLEPDDFLMVMACLASMGDSLRRMTKVNNILQRSNAAATRIFETMAVPIERRRDVRMDGKSAPPSPQHESARIKLPPIQREVRFDNVTFSYPNASGPALIDVSLTVPKGQSVAVVGRNGSGKTTMLALLPRFYDPQQGSVLIDGVDIRHATLRSLRSQISIVTQDSVLFPGTIEQNIAYGDYRPDRQRVIDAAGRAFAHEFILQKNKGYDTLVGENGAQLSGGQKQRLCIARAIYQANPILVLDEATSQVDAESEHLIQQAIESLMHQRTTFIIAHRFSTILSADTIIVLERGRIVGQGPHEQLLQNCPTYQQLYERQLLTTPA
ncbi:MAG: ABC transporter ATP-binding protein [Phycisphaerales bacterium]|jgi:ABC-type multidrug transport system fused ATPase/permease subunit|nr:ABC transporter ATP-binding protein [Phycisphaerales bacterium]